LMDRDSVGTDPEKDLQAVDCVGGAGNLPDGRLLERFAAGRDRSAEAAFATLVERHGPMVLRVCRQVLGDSDDAQDAFQATFLVLVRKANSVRKRDSVASWLHGVARRLAMRAKADAARRRAHEGRGAAMAAESVGDTAEDWPELHDEVARLPEKYREPVVLCYLEGLSAELAARRIGCPRGTVLSRLARARERLRPRLIRRGLALSAGFLAAGSASRPAAALPATLRDSTVQAMMRFAAGKGAVSAAAVALTQDALRAMLMTKLKLAAAFLLMVGVAIGTVLVAHRARGGPQRDAPAERRSGPAVEERDRSGDDAAARRIENLKHIGLAMLDAGRGGLPAAAIRGADGTPLLSWRVAILPHIGQGDLFRQFRLDEPWDGPHNKVLISRMPDVYATGGEGRGAEGSTYYRVFVGPGAAFEGERGIATSEVRDGLGKTIMVVEAGEPVPWTKPEGLPYSPGKPLPPLGGLSPDGFHALFCNGEVRFVKKGVDPKKLRSVITRSGGEPVGGADVGEVAR
jgi:RNA polymerase sigma factor (sigma-70 family)